jgi:FkbM family methyltransferase
MNLKHQARRGLKKAIFGLGLDVKRLSPVSNPQLRLLKFLDRNEISTIFDIGANCGQFALKLREIGYSKTIISAEPLSSAYKALSANARYDSQWIVLPRLAVSDTSGIKSINISGNSVSSSLNDMLDVHLQVQPDSRYIQAEQVEADTFENIYSLFSNETIPIGPCLLKIDTQGHEFNVLQGCGETLQKLSAILLELSPESMYSNEKSMQFLIEWLNERGFKLWDISPAFVDPYTGRVLQYDGLFANTVSE